MGTALYGREQPVVRSGLEGSRSEAGVGTAGGEPGLLPESGTVERSQSSAQVGSGRWSSGGAEMRVPSEDSRSSKLRKYLSGGTKS